MSEPRGLWWRLVRFGFRLLYYELAWTYDLVSRVVSLGQWRRWQQAALPRLGDPDLVLEIAHGTANLQLDMVKAGIKSVAVDLSPHMGRIAKRKLTRKDAPVRLAQASALELPFPDGAFDAVVTTFPTPFFIEPETLNEVHRVLRRGGRYVIVPSALLDLTGLLPRFLEWLYAITGQRGSLVDDIAARFDTFGYHAHVEKDKLPASTVWIIVAEKR